MRRTMVNMKKAWGSWLLMPFLLLFMSACSGGDDSVSTSDLPAPTFTTVSGTAAAGAPIVGTVNIRGANGAISTSAIRADGSYTVDVAALTPPFLIWAEGTANGQSVRLYSTVQAAGEVANVTPATNLIMTMALGTDPAVVYGAYGDKNTSDTAADLPPVPEAAAIIAAAADVKTLLTSVFASLDMPADFDLMNGRFVADGSKFDSILDTVSFQVDSSDPENVTVTIADKATKKTLYNDNVSIETDTATVLAPNDAAAIVASGLSFQEQALTAMKKLETLYATSVPDLATLQQQFQPYMAADFLDEGQGAEDMLSQWSSDKHEGPSIGLKIVAINIYRAMGEQTMPDGTKLSEMPGHTEGYWCILTVEEGGRQEAMLTSFVKDSDGVYKWYGNRNPFEQGGQVRSRHFRSSVPAFDGNAPPSGIMSMWSGLDLWTDDLGNVAKDTYGIDAVAVLHPALPDMTDVDLKGVHGLLLVNDPETPDTQLQIVSVGPQAHGHSWMFSEEDGLNLAGLKAGDEFVFVGASMDGTPKWVWIDRLASVPLAAASLTADHFATITAPTSRRDVTIPGAVTVSWTMPTAQTATSSWCNIGWGDGMMDWSNMDMDNPDKTKGWTSTTFDTSATAVSASYLHVEITVSSNEGTEFTTQVSFQ